MITTSITHIPRPQIRFDDCPEIFENWRDVINDLIEAHPFRDETTTDRGIKAVTGYRIPEQQVEIDVNGCDLIPRDFCGVLKIGGCEVRWNAMHDNEAGYERVEDGRRIIVVVYHVTEVC